MCGAIVSILHAVSVQERLLSNGHDVTESHNLHGRRGREVPFFRTRHKHIPVGLYGKASLFSG